MRADRCGHSSGVEDHASQAGGELPDKVDPQRDSGLLSRFVIDPADLRKQFGGGTPGGLGGKLGL